MQTLLILVRRTNTAHREPTTLAGFAGNVRHGGCPLTEQQGVGYCGDSAQQLKLLEVVAHTG